MSVQILVGDCRHVLKGLPDRSVHLVVCSPPYWGQRDYGTALWVDGDAACDHLAPLPGGTAASGLGDWGSQSQEGIEAKVLNRQRQYRHKCKKCGAARVDQQIGLEPTVDQYVETLVEVFREVRRVLRDDGTLWINLGDSYAGGGNGNGGSFAADRANWRTVPTRSGQRGAVKGLKPKDLVGVPWRVAFALQADGWWLRQDIIWAKRNPMPESVWDRCTKAHEYIFMFAKNGRKPLLWRHSETRAWSETIPAPDYRWRHRKTKERTAEPQEGKEWVRLNLWSGYDYFYDAEAIMEPSSPDSHARAARGRSNHHKNADGGPGGQTIAVDPPSPGRLVPKGTGPNSHVNVDRVPRSRKRPGVNPKAEMALNTGGPRVKQNADWSASIGTGEMVEMRNKRSVWATASDSYPGAHFATYPPALIEPIIKAGCPAGGVVLDPFGGAGTTALVADREGRDCILVELNSEYAEMARERLRDDAGLFAKVG